MTLFMVMRRTDVHFVGGFSAPQKDIGPFDVLAQPRDTPPMFFTREDDAHAAARWLTAASQRHEEHVVLEVGVRVIEARE